MSDLLTFLLDAPGSPTSRIPVARLGDYKDKRYGEFSITAKDVDEWQHNLEKLPGGRALIDEDHLANKPSPHRRTKASGWVTKVELDGDGKQVWGDVEWTPRGKEAIANKEYLFTSPTYGPYTTDDGEKLPNVLSGLALTNKPFLTSMPQISLASDEAISRALENDPAAALYMRALDGEFGEQLQTIALDPVVDPIDLSMVELDEAGEIIGLDALSTEARNNLSGSDFALPGRRYPIHDLAHARNALARVAQSGDSDEQSKVKAAVYRKYPDLKPPAKTLDSSDRRGQMFTKETIKTLASIAGITDQAEIDNLVALTDNDGGDEAKVLEAIEAAKPEPAPEKTLEELAEAKGVKILPVEEHTQLEAKAGEADTLRSQLEARENAPEGEKNLEQLAEESGKILLDAGQLETLQSAAAEVAPLRLAVKQLDDNAKAAEKELSDQVFETAFEKAVNQGKAAPAQKDRLKGFYELDAENTLTLLEETPALVGVKPRGANISAVGDDVPAGHSAEEIQLEAQVQAHVAEHKVDYMTALEAVTGVTL